jgi:two-component system sensor histidine kinase UhpB
VRLIWRVLAVNAVVVVAAALVLALSPLTISSPLQPGEAAALAVGALLLVAVDFALLHRILGPLHDLNAAMRAVDPLRPGARVSVRTSEPELREVAESFNDMAVRLEQERAASARRAIAAQEGERRRVSRELHDEIGQLLTGVLLRLTSIEDRAPDALRPELSGARDDVRRSMDDVRLIAQQLRPPMLETLGLPSALGALAHDIEQQAGIRVDRQLDRGVRGLPDELEVVVYRVAQESLTNVVRHAGATQATLRLQRGDGVMVLEVADVGDGFHPGQADSTAGLSGMRERALLVGGQLTITSRPGAGTRVRLTLPLPEPAV